MKIPNLIKLLDAKCESSLGKIIGMIGILEKLLHALVYSSFFSSYDPVSSKFINIDEI